MASYSTANRLSKLLMKEYLNMRSDPPHGIVVIPNQRDDLTEWTLEMYGPNDSIYAGEEFKLLFVFNDDYPFKPPKVNFVPPQVPVNPHVFSNGDICLSILTRDWRPCLNVEAVCVSIQSMLASCKHKKRPPDNDYYLHMKATNPAAYRWVYYNDKA
ncbi:probable ubiquitin-conjugating enzyme E2 W-A [Galendromus occidentalis]|uniref:Probable ubiquitin-conjugating enzyme E2 W-A n=1 Tax=Galendromus occidentalis TaxID=34638 RepID=A0AAJ6QQ03_9ACAR|nr:probable ubiquitin-conjugating enzyme E2 W-A [Galendromus occidentalis]XP_003740034.1 probable ubiquitin-conjugating enzyme E2 W-A [Galendromus occidentalis]